MKARDLVLVAVFTALTIVGAQIYIPIGNVPITFQALFVILSGLILIGLPVFAGFKGGIVHIVSPTGGYIISFPIAAWIVGMLSKNRSFLRYMLPSCIGVVIIYILGFIWLGVYVKSLKSAFLMGVLPFILGIY